METAQCVTQHEDFGSIEQDMFEACAHKNANKDVKLLKMTMVLG